MKQTAHRTGWLAGLVVFLAFVGPVRAQAGDAAFLEACWKGDRARVEAFLAQGVDVNAPGQDGNTGLHYAVEYGQREITVLLLDRGAKINAPGNRGITPLHIAVGLYQDPALEFTRLLLERGANPNARNDDGVAPLHIAMTHRRGRTDLVEILLAAGAEVEPRDKQGQTPLFRAAGWGDGPKLALLLARGANPRARDNDGNTPLHRAASPAGTESVPGMKDVILALLAAGAEVNARNTSGKIPLYDAQSYLPPEIVALLLAHGADTTPRWPLRDAAKAGDRARVEALLTAGVDINLRDDQGRTALHEAVIAQQAEVVRLLLTRRADVNVRDISKCTPLYYAARAGDKVIVNYLFSRGAEVNYRANDYMAGNTPLHAAAQAKQNSLVLVEMLLARGAVIDAANDYGETPADYAMFGHNREAGELLLARSVDRSLSHDADAAVQEGITAAQAANYPAAIRHFEAARRLAPNSPLPRYYLGQAEAKIPGRELRAICWFKSYLAAAPRASERRAITVEIAALQDRSTDLLADLLTALTAAADAQPMPSDNEAADPDGPPRDHFLMTVAVLWARLGDEKKALERASLVTSVYVRSQTEIKIAEAIAGTGDLDSGRTLVAQAVATAMSSPRRDRREWALAQAAEALVNLGDNAGAQAVAGRIEDARVRADTVVTIARVQAEAGDPAGALLTASGITVHFYRSVAQAAIARAAAESGDQSTAARALQQARKTLALVTSNGTNVHSGRGLEMVAAQALSRDRLGRTIYPSDPPALTVAQVNALGFDTSGVYRDCFVTDALLGNFNRDDAWKYRLEGNERALLELGRAQARLGNQPGVTELFTYLNGPGPYSRETSKDWGPGANVMLAGMHALHGDYVAANYRLRLARVSAEKMDNDMWRNDALQSIATAGNSWLAAVDGFLNDPVFLDLPGHLRMLPRDRDWVAFNALADTTLAVADAQRTVATMRPRPIRP